MTVLDEAIKAYIDNCKADGKSEATVEGYSSVLNRFAENGTATPTSVLAYKTSLIGSAPATVRLYMTILAGFFAWSHEMGFFDTNPCPSSLIPKVKSDRKPYKNLLTTDKLMELSSEERPLRGKIDTWERDRAILVLLLTSALRNSELRALKVSDLDFVNSRITVWHGKGDKYRIAPFPPTAQAVVKDYLMSGYRPADAELLFGVSNNGWHGFTREALSKLIERKIRQKTGIEGIRSHALRHNSASTLLDNGVPMDIIRDVLGHASVATTQRYAERLNPESSVALVNSVLDKLA